MITTIVQLARDLDLTVPEILDPPLDPPTVARAFAAARERLGLDPDSTEEEVLIALGCTDELIVRALDYDPDDVEFGVEVRADLAWRATPERVWSRGPRGVEVRLPAADFDEEELVEEVHAAFLASPATRDAYAAACEAGTCEIDVQADVEGWHRVRVLA